MVILTCKQSVEFISLKTLKKIVTGLHKPNPDLPFGKFSLPRGKWWLI